jgi:lysophospholipase L1-like esterase
MPRDESRVRRERDHTPATLAFALSCVLAGCGSGCDAERRKLVDAPRPRELARARGDAGPVASAPGRDAGPVASQSLLDAPSATLDPLFGALAAAERGEPTARVLWLVFGDSHTAGDSLTQRLRYTLQSRFGDAGRGLVAAGRPPTRHYYQRDVRYGASGRWRAAVGGHKRADEPFGIAGLRVSGRTKGAQLWVESCAECPLGGRVAQFEILYYAAPDHGALRYRVDAGPWQQRKTRTAAIEPPHPARLIVPVADRPHKLTLEHGGGGVIDLFGVVLERLRPGVIVDSLGVVGRRLASLRSWDWSVIGEQLASRDPRIVVLQYGSNEADDPDLDLEAMARYFDETILRIRAAAPSAAILILGPPDMATREGGKPCDRRKPDAPPIAECEWRTPHVLGEIIAVQRAAAARNRVAFFDTFAAMGGADRMHGWVTAEPRLAHKDHVHFSDLGYQTWADLLSSAVLADYDRWRAAQGLPPSADRVAAPPLTPSDAALPGDP